MMYLFSKFDIGQLLSESRESEDNGYWYRFMRLCESSN